MSYNDDLINKMNAVMNDDLNMYGESSYRVERAMLDLAQLMTGEDRDVLKRHLRIGDLPEDTVPKPVGVAELLEELEANDEPTPKLEALAKHKAPWDTTT